MASPQATRSRKIDTGSKSPSTIIQLSAFVRLPRLCNAGTVRNSLARTAQPPLCHAERLSTASQRHLRSCPFAPSWPPSDRGRIPPRRKTCGLSRRGRIGRPALAVWMYWRNGCGCGCVCFCGMRCLWRSRCGLLLMKAWFRL